ncbi:MAG: HAMP domain-containing protein [Desulfamplus sp.]|nr:HAMP domain-containing protein [Desulfamplus sp.]
MINISCASCGKNYKLDPKIIKSENAKFTCNTCGHINPIDQYINKPESLNKPDTQTHKIAAKPQVTESRSRVQKGQSQMNSDIIKVTWKNRLQVKVNAVLTSLILVIMTIFVVITYIAEKQTMETELNNMSKIAVKRLSIYIVDAFWSLDNEILSESLKSEMMDNNIYSINLIDRNGKFYLGYKRDKDWNLIENNTLIEGDHIKSEEDIIKDSKKIGQVQVYFSSKFVQKQFNQSMYKLIIAVFLLLIAVSLAAYLVLNHMILSPIGRLTEIANKISIGNLDLEIPIESKDEIGVLADAFARMKVSMGFAIKQLRKR